MPSSRAVLYKLRLRPSRSNLTSVVSYFGNTSIWMPPMSFRDHIESGCSKERRMAHLCSSYLTFDSVSLAKRHCNKFYGSGLGCYLSVIQGGSNLTYGVQHQELLRSRPVVGMHRLVSVFIAIYILHIQAICLGQRHQICAFDSHFEKNTYNCPFLPPIAR